MLLPRLEGFLQRWVRLAAESRLFLPLTGLLAFTGTATALFPVTSVVVPAVLLVPERWKQLALVTALGSALGATALVLFFHHLGWSQIYVHFPELTNQVRWVELSRWINQHGTFALFVIAASPLPQTPALAFFSLTEPDYAAVFGAMLMGKGLKYSVFAWISKRFPRYFAQWLGANKG